MFTANCSLPKERLSNILNSQLRADFLCLFVSCRCHSPSWGPRVWVALEEHVTTVSQTTCRPGLFSQSEVLLSRDIGELGLSDSYPQSRPWLQRRSWCGQRSRTLFQSPPKPCLFCLINFCPPFSQKGSPLRSQKGERKL